MLNVAGWCPEETCGTELLGFREGFALRDVILWQDWRTVWSPGKVFYSDRLNLRSTKLQRREKATKVRTHFRTGVNYKICFSTALCVFTDLAAQTQKTMYLNVPQQLSSSNQNGTFFCPFLETVTYPLCPVLQIPHMILRCESICS